MGSRKCLLRWTGGSLLLSFFIVNHKTKLPDVCMCGSDSKQNFKNRKVESWHLCFCSFVYLQRIEVHADLGSRHISQNGVWICIWNVEIIFFIRVKEKQEDKQWYFPSSVAHSWTSAVRCWKCLRIAKDILVLKVNQARMAPLTSKNLRGWRIINHFSDDMTV